MQKLKPSNSLNIPRASLLSFSSQIFIVFYLNHHVLLSHPTEGNKIRILVKTGTAHTHWERFNLKLEFMIKVGVTLFKITSAKLCAFSLFGLYPHLIRFNVIGWISSEFTRNFPSPERRIFHNWIKFRWS